MKIHEKARERAFRTKGRVLGTREYYGLGHIYRGKAGLIGMGVCCVPLPLMASLYPPNQKSPPTGASSFTLSHIHIEAAKQYASLAIAMEYQFNCANKEALQCQLEEIIGYWKDTWFTLGERERDFPSTEDQVLVKVLATLLFQVKTAENSWTRTSNSLGEELVVIALMLVSDTTLIQHLFLIIIFCARLQRL